MNIRIPINHNTSFPKCFRVDTAISASLATHRKVYIDGASQTSVILQILNMTFQIQRSITSNEIIDPCKSFWTRHTRLFQKIHLIPFFHFGRTKKEEKKSSSMKLETNTTKRHFWFKP